jgi:2-polyprenyl-3-methyl-5-hydroxy-6-metoxy-1,4-benzoquinol methylase
VVLPAEAGDDDGILPLRAPYRVDGAVLTIAIESTTRGNLEAELLAYEGHFPTRRLWLAPAADYRGPCELTLDVTTGDISLGGLRWGTVPLPLPGRRFCWRLTLRSPGIGCRTRLVSHYIPVEARSVDEGYFCGDNYVDYAAQSRRECEAILDLLRDRRPGGPILEIGCATGEVLEGLALAGYPAVGLDISDWAVEQATQRLGPDRVWKCDVEQESPPDEALRKGPFGALLLWAVLEHFRSPFQVVAKLTPLARQGALLLLRTTNCESLTHWIFGPQWEGYFDWTHHGVDQVGVSSLRRELTKLGWRVEQLTTHLVWDASADPTRATLREWWAQDARFRRLLAERDLGDLITCVAVKE